MEDVLRHGEGPVQGKPLRLQPWALDFMASFYEYDAAYGDDPKGGWLNEDDAVLAALSGDGIARDQAHWLHLQAVAGVPKGNIKTELLAAIGLEHMAGPTSPRTRPIIPVAATTDLQADLILGSAREMIVGTPLERHFKATAKSLIYLPTRARMYRVAGSIGANDGPRPSLVLADELHEWDAQWIQASRRWTILRNGLRKRRGRILGATTAGWNLESLLGGLYELGCKIARGELVDEQFLFWWREASAHLDLDDPEQLLEAIYEANPVADVCWPAEDLVLAYHELKARGLKHEFERYHLNRWVSSIETWVPLEAWDERIEERMPPPAGADVVIGFDGSYSGDSTAVIGVDVSGRTPWVWVIGTWERPEPAPDDWKVPISEVKAYLAVACAGWNVLEVAADLNHWRGTLEELAEAGLPIVEFSQQANVMVPACHRFYEAVIQGGITHSGDPRLRRHLANCRAKTTESGVRIAKEHPNSRRYIDLAAAAVMGFDRAVDPDGTNAPGQTTFVAVGGDEWDD
jgi:phage terminase large subunit-like protein